MITKEHTYGRHGYMAKTYLAPAASNMSAHLAGS